MHSARAGDSSMNAKLKPTWSLSLARWRRPALLTALALAVLAPVVYSTVELVRFERADARRTTFVYASGQSLAPGVHVQRIALAATLTRLGYGEARGIPKAPGQFRRAGGTWEIFLCGAEDGGRDSRLVQLQVDDDRITHITDGGQEIRDAALEGELLASAMDRPGEDHRPVRLD